MERRLSAILAADMVGYSRLMEADEEGTIARLKSYRITVIDPALAEFHGRIVKEMGDGLLVEFSSVVEAVRCAVSIQEAVTDSEAGINEDRRIQFRVGINLGDIVVDGEEIYGDGVNIAARLEQLSEPGGICISGTAYDHLHSTLEFGYQSLGDVQVKNIERPIRAYKVLTEPQQSGTVTKAASSMGFSRQALIALLLVGLIGGGAWWWWSEQTNFEAADPKNYAYALPDKPSIAVLPFANMSDDPQQAFLADGLTEDLITELAKISGLFVISRNSVFTYKDKAVKIRQVAEELGVRFVLEGSVRRLGDQLRITGQLIDAASGGHLWAENYDGAIQDVFSFQDEVRAQIVKSLEVALTPEESKTLQGVGTENVEAYEQYLKGMALLSQAVNLVIDPLIQARQHFESALELDPDFSQAQAALAWNQYLTAVYSNEVGDLKKTLRLAAEAHEEQESALTFVVLSKEHFRPRAAGYGEFGMGYGHEKAVALLEEAMALEPGNADVIAELALVLVFSGDIDRAAALIEDAIRLNPSYPVWYRMPSGMIGFFRGRYEAAIEDFRVWSDAEPSLPSTVAKFWLAAAQALSGKTIAASQTLSTFTQLYPAASTQFISSWLSFADRAMWDEFERGLIAAGMPPPPE